ncbi:Dehydrogenase (flavoprotein) [Tistlia consotensis]|uniref:Dehydrogenase (Flavoprotein) n=1 Tax=Tistlia consotensis USBA 355 TaxID=560819 RepID=A0A1Y6BYY3_9PROT|nr:NAD(P)/FAD-dependent oxidoreductase [Tistlia consotensis]SMF27818.1 Dehydrogenase (flavoprotein) [Tistlia consotensis USBA 355]SNR65594.1 Dehydrogenase (flavoprotein) [Tistlia consotensis]
MSTRESRVDPRRKASGPVTVVGAGPAGLACAVALARAGLPVIVREWHRDVGTRFHGDFQGLENWSDEQDVLDELMAAGIRASFEHHPVSRGIVFDSRGGRYPVQSRQPLFYLVRRGSDEGSLDRALLRQAVAAGAEVRFEDRVGASRGPSVLAIGPRSADAIAVGYLFETDGPDGAWLILDHRLAPLGYAYLLIQGGRGTVATCLFGDFRRQADYLARTVAAFRDRADLEMRDPRPFGGFVNFRLPRSAVQGGSPVVGEQAGFQDALAGFGMRYALRSGLLAARSILEGTDYTILWRSELLPLLQAGTVNRFVFNLTGERGWRAAARRLGQGDAREALGRFYRPSVASRLLFPVARLRYRAPLHDPSCDHIDCHCVWCECRAEIDRTAIA